MTSWTRRNAQNMKRSRKAWETRKRMFAARGWDEDSGAQKDDGNGFETHDETLRLPQTGVADGDEASGH